MIKHQLICTAIASVLSLSTISSLLPAQTAEAAVTAPAQIKNVSMTPLDNKAGFKLKWGKGSAGTDGYQVLYSRNVRALENANGEVPKKNSKDYNYVHSWSTTVNDTSENFTRVPESGELWYAKIRAYKLVNGKRLYGKFSSIHQARTKTGWSVQLLRNQMSYSYEPTQYSFKISNLESNTGVANANFKMTYNTKVETSGDKLKKTYTLTIKPTSNTFINQTKKLSITYYSDPLSWNLQHNTYCQLNWFGGGWEKWYGCVPTSLANISKLNLNPDQARDKLAQYGCYIEQDGISQPHLYVALYNMGYKPQTSKEYDWKEGYFHYSNEANSVLDWIDDKPITDPSEQTKILKRLVTQLSNGRYILGREPTSSGTGHCILVYGYNLKYDGKTGDIDYVNSKYRYVDPLTGYECYKYGYQLLNTNNSGLLPIDIP